MPLKRHGSASDPEIVPAEPAPLEKPPRRCNRLRGVLLACAVLALLSWAAVRLGGRRPHLGGWVAAAAEPQQPQQQQQAQQCRLQLDGSPWERHCQRLRRVCLDQGTLVLYNDRYQQLDGRRAGALPELLVDTSKVCLHWEWMGRHVVKA